MTVLKWMYENEGYKGYGDIFRAWRCPLCGDVRQGDAPPAECPNCLAPGTAFSELGKKGKVSMHTGETRKPGLFPRRQNRSLFDAYMKQEADRWTRSIRS